LDSGQQNLAAAQLAMMRSVLARGLGKHAESASHAEEAARLVPPEVLDAAGTAWNMLGAARAGAGNPEGTIEAYARGIEPTYGAGNLVGAYTCLCGQTMYLIAQGRLNEADDTCRSVIERGLREGHGDLPAVRWSDVVMAQIELERYRLDKAEAGLNDGLRIARPGGFGELLCAGRCLRPCLAVARGNQDGAVEILQDTERIVDAMDGLYLTGDLARHRTAVCLNTGDLHGARTKLTDLEQVCTATRHANLLIARDWLAVRLLCAEGRYDEALAGLAEAIRRARVSNSAGFLVRLLALQSVALDATGKREPARAVLREGMALGARGGCIRCWVDAGPSITPLLRDVIDRGNPSQVMHLCLDSLLGVCRIAFGDPALYPAHQLAGEMLDPLTARDFEMAGIASAFD
jgi:ATP/maltotriose-dependent transcriptional regulator MalT